MHLKVSPQFLTKSDILNCPGMVNLGFSFNLINGNEVMHKLKK